MAKGKTWKALTNKKRQELARRVADEAFGKRSAYHVGQAGKVIDNLVNLKPSKYLNFYDKYCTPIDDDIVSDAVETIRGENVRKGMHPDQISMFD